ncbi:hypothetical protein VE04_05818 [Pseudogymnoascus sp. 24MN13]|nr:hypothetical protein VE04_05818 [Pseudogymnoascus sp. 24MN13]
MKPIAASLFLTIASLATAAPGPLAPPAMGERCPKYKDVTCGVINESVFLDPLVMLQVADYKVYSGFDQVYVCSGNPR